MRSVLKEARFDLYCKKCVYSDKAEDSEPCTNCLSESFRYDSHKPIYFKQKSQSEHAR